MIGNQYGTISESMHPGRTSMKHSKLNKMSEGLLEGSGLPPRIRHQNRPQSAPRYQELRGVNRSKTGKKKTRPQTGHPNPEPEEQ